MKKASTETCVCAGVDVGKARLDYAIAGGPGPLYCANTPEGRAEMISFFKRHGVRRVGLEASGSYEIEVVDDLREAGFEVLVMQPLQVRAYGQFKLKRAKSDPIDAVLIAQCTAACDEVREAPDARLAPFAEHLTFIDQLTEDIARLCTRRERFRDPRLKQQLNDDIKQKNALKRRELQLLAKAVRLHKDLARKLELLISIQGIALPTALVLVIRMPELGKITREQAAALIGAAPFVHDSGRYKGQRRTGGGRARARTSLFAAAQAARQWNPALKTLYERLIKQKKAHNVAIIACVRKLVTYANTVLARDKPWAIKNIS